MMNRYEKALEILKDRVTIDSCGCVRRFDEESRYAIYLLERLVDKQIPVLMDVSGYTDVCPKCNSEVFGVGTNYDDRDFFYCPVCGQKLSLKEEDYE